MQKMIIKTFKLLTALILCVFLFSCGAAKVDKNTSWEVKFLDEYIIPANQEFENTKIGGLSDLDYDGKFFYTICDLPSSPRVYKFHILLNQQKIDTVIFDEVIKINRKSKLAKTKFWDSEGLIYDQKNHNFIISSEGSIKKNKNPFIAVVNTEGDFLEAYKIPEYFKANAEKGLRNNGVFEGLSKSYDKKGIWAATELPMKRDGGKVKLYKTKSPIRVTYFDENLKVDKQCSYTLDRLRKIPLLPFGWSGVSAILTYDDHKFLFLERSFSAGYGSRGNRVRLFDVNAEKATNTLEIDKIKGKIHKEVIPAEKNLIFDFNQIKSKLTNRIIDNLEGIAFGPTLPNGNQSLLVISDNNFSSWTPQLNQIILLELIKK